MKFTKKNYGNNIKEMPHNVYTGEELQYASNKKFYFIGKSKMISKLIEN